MRLAGHEARIVTMINTYKTLENLKGRDQLGDLVLERRIILEWIFEK
jgi:hypothetical protein